MILTSVDLPAPLSPSSATTSPLPIEKLMPFSASMAPKFLRDVVEHQQRFASCRQPLAVQVWPALALGGEHLAEARREHAGHGKRRGAAQHRMLAAAWRP